jgi:very-short-patch-repair endonuclease
MYHDLARQLRNNMTDAEHPLWSRLRGRQFGGFKFRKQAPIGPYIVDFVCFEAKLIIELDGGQHMLRDHEDEIRTAWLNTQGFQVLRYWNHLVFEDLDPLLEAIWRALHADRDHAPHPDPPPQGGRENS